MACFQLKKKANFAVSVIEQMIFAEPSPWHPGAPSRTMTSDPGINLTGSFPCSAPGQPTVVPCKDTYCIANFHRLFMTILQVLSLYAKLNSSPDLQTRCEASRALGTPFQGAGEGAGDAAVETAQATRTTAQDQLHGPVHPSGRWRSHFIETLI